MTSTERWQWHAEVYAFRRVQLEVSVEERTSPCDPDGVWFDERLVNEATRLLRDKRERGFRRREWARADEAAREAPAICAAWARSRGYPDFAAAEADGYDKFDVGRSIQEASAIEAPRGSVAQSLGVRAREYRPEELRKGRIALGLESEEAAE